MHRHRLVTLAVVTFLSLVCSAQCMKRNVRADEDALPGWRGTDYQPELTAIDTRVGRMKVLDADARIFMIENFLTDDEADHIIGMSEPHMERSGVVATSGSSTISNIRTSTGVFLDRSQDDVLKRIEERISAWTLMPVQNGEGLQVLRYEKTQKYEAHWDYFFHKEGTANGGNRYATVLMYLATTEEGGETVFPNIPAPGGKNDDSFSECARYHLAAKPRKGDAILFHSIQPSGELEKKSLHTACPVIKGIKWSAAKWIHVGHYAMGGEAAEAIQQHPQPKYQSVEGCDDSQDMCESWAASGECESNPSFMIGTRARPGACVRSCNRCDIVTTSGAEKQQNEALSAGNRKFKV